MAAKAGEAHAQSYVKAKQLRYDEGRPGVTVDESELEAVIQFEDNDKLNLLLVNDVITGASPTGIPQSQTTTGASSVAGVGVLARGQGFTPSPEKRQAATIGYSWQATREIALNAMANQSHESDYHSDGGGVGAVLELNKKNTTLAVNYRAANDQVNPKNVAIHPEGKGKKQTEEGSLSVSQLVGKAAIVTLGGFYGKAKGQMNDPYKKVMAGGVEIFEKRPDRRENFGGTAQVKLGVTDGLSMDLRYRYYTDDWKISSQTVQLGAIMELSEEWLVDGHFRHYTQTGASFYKPVFASVPDYYSSDVRLSPFVAETLSVTGIWRQSENWWYDATLAKYVQVATGGGGAPSNGGEEEEEGLPIFNDSHAMLKAYVFSVSAQYRF